VHRRLKINSTSQVNEEREREYVFLPFDSPLCEASSDRVPEVHEVRQLKLGLHKSQTQNAVHKRKRDSQSEASVVTFDASNWLSHLRLQTAFCVSIYVDRALCVIRQQPTGSCSSITRQQ